MNDRDHAPLSAREAAELARRIASRSKVTSADVIAAIRQARQDRADSPTGPQD